MDMIFSIESTGVVFIHHHYFSIIIVALAGVTIEEFKKDLGVANAIYEKNGFGKARYKVYEVKSDDPAEQHRYMWLSTWQSDAEYENSHSDEIADFWDNYFTPKYRRMLDEHVYRKFFTVE